MGEQGVVRERGVSVFGEGEFPAYVANSELEARLNPNQLYSLRKKYLLRDKDGELIESPAGAIYRMARTMAEVEHQYGASKERVEELTEDFFHMIDRSEFSPAGRIWTNAGTQITGLFNCYVLPVEDSMDLNVPDSIYITLAKAAVIHKNGGGTGYNFSRLRPRGVFVQSSKGMASGPVSFIGQFDKETEVINSGNRRGANMGILNVSHPDILDFITAKSMRGKITNFNVSVGATDEFMGAVENGEFYDLEFPRGEPFTYQTLERLIINIEENKVGGAEVGGIPDPASLKSETGEFVPGTRLLNSYSGEIAGRIDERGVVQLFAPYVFNLISRLAHSTGDPGMIFLDPMNRTNPLPNLGPYEATNPCGEQPLHPYDACNLGSLILSNFVRFVKTNDGVRPEIDWDKLRRTTQLATRFMDNVNDANKGPISEVERTVLSHRRIGMGVMGWADMLVKLGVPYDSPDAIGLAKEVMGFITDTAKATSVALAKEKGVFPAFEGSKYDDGKLENRVRNLERTTIAPTGTISMVYDASPGIEPLYAVAFRKNIRGGDTLEYINPLFKEEIKKRGLDLDRLLTLIEKNHGSVQGISEIPEDLQQLFKTAHDLDYTAHVAVQAAFQERTDNAVSKTINMKSDSTEEEVKGAYMLAWKSGCKGITIYRDGSKDVQVLETGRGNEKKAGGLEKVTIDLTRISRPEAVGGRTVRVQTPYGEKDENGGPKKSLHAYVSLNRVLEGEHEGRDFELFVSVGKAGGDIHANIEGYARLGSLAFKKGATAQEVIDQLIGIKGEHTSGVGPEAVASLPDAIGKGLKKILESEGKKVDGGNGLSGNICPECSAPLAMQEGCQKCLNPVCGFSKC